ncbi:hypothetical protein DNTS_027481 [Danionella cerebrum]|uniref:Cortexin 1 n=1 Tax=Danionella cerebrum TaxID=2873325 RepID=A0A553RMC1_9TELE|nr:hypothetical protein DNTS_027481 [Danionella translucida]
MHARGLMYSPKFPAETEAADLAEACASEAQRCPIGSFSSCSSVHHPLVWVNNSSSDVTCDSGALTGHFFTLQSPEVLLRLMYVSSVSSTSDRLKTTLRDVWAHMRTAGSTHGTDLCGFYHNRRLIIIIIIIIIIDSFPINAVILVSHVGPTPSRTLQSHLPPIIPKQSLRELVFIHLFVSCHGFWVKSDRSPALTLTFFVHFEAKLANHSIHPTLQNACRFCRRAPWRMNDVSTSDYEQFSVGPSFPGFPSSAPFGVDAEQRTAFAFVGLLMLFLVFLLVRCFRILLDPYSRMPASSWTDHKEGFERGQFDYALV